MQDELISVIVPVYNVQEYLEECVNSILNQTYSKLEIILVDDGSTDESGKLCDEIAKTDERVSVLHKTNGGLSSARNYGIDHSSGSLLAFIDSDDYLDRTFIETLYSDLKNNNADFSCCCFMNAMPEGRTEQGVAKYTSFQVLSGEDMLFGIYDDFSAWNKLYRRELFSEIRYPEGKLFEDARTTYKLARISKTVTYNPVCLYYYRQRQTSIMGTINPTRYLDRVNVWNELIEGLKDRFTDEQIVCLKIRKNKLAIELISSILSQRKFKEHSSTFKALAREIGYDVIDKNHFSKRERLVASLAKLYRGV